MVLALLSLAAGGRASADLRPPARPRGAPPMRFVRVVSADPACVPSCPEWLSAEGRIEPGTARGLAQALDALKGRRLPILIHSPGGSVRDAIEMGDLIRARGLAVAVARTLITNCPERAPKCPDGPGTAIAGGAMCASACVLVLAGGVERLVGPTPLIGVHQMTTVVKETEGAAGLTSTRKFYEQYGVDAVVGAYHVAMGVGDPVMALTRKTAAASVRWLSLADLKASHLATLALDAAEPVVTSGANGLNGRALDGDPPRADLMQASLTEPFTLAVGRVATLAITLGYRRGGGAVEAEMTARDADMREVLDPPVSGWSLALTRAGGEPLQLTMTGTPARAPIPREAFCALASGGALVAAPPAESGAWAGYPPIAFKLGQSKREMAVFDEACPS